MTREEISPEEMRRQTVGDMVAADYRAAAVFERHGIDFCCGGNVALSEICRERGIDTAQLLRELDEATARPMDRSQNFGSWDLAFLADYIVNTHHAYVRESAGDIAGYAHKIAEVHGGRHPELRKIAQIFDSIIADLKRHMRDEEELLFPAIRRLSSMDREAVARDSFEQETLRHSLKVLRHEHDDVGAAIHEIRDLSHGYKLPGDACNTFMLAFRMLQEFEDDLHKHVHLENNILFPKAERL